MGAALLILGLLLALPFPAYMAYMLFVRSPLRVAYRTPAPASCSMIIVAHDAAELVERKLSRLGELNYPAQCIEVIVYCDGCTDDTAERARRAMPGAIVIEETRQQGKIRGMNRAVARASHPLLVFSDADALPEPDALERLLAHFADPSIGGVCGHRILRDDTPGGLGEAQRGYFSVDNSIKLAENGWGSISSNDGKWYAVRREAWQDVPDAVTDDLYVSLCVVEAGYRFVYEPGARVRVNTPSRDLGHEMTRRRRIVSTSLRGIWMKRHLLDPRRTGRYALSLGLNKVMRRLMPLGLVCLLAGGLWLLPLAWSLPMFAAVVLAGSLFDCLPGALLRRSARRAAYFGTGILGTVAGLWDLLRGRAPSAWRPQKDEPAAGPVIAYTMSRFPKITETFVLYEILAIRALGLRVEIYPLLLERENTAHPEVAALMPDVHFASFAAPAVLRANLCWLVQHPRTYLGAWMTALRSAWPNRNFLVGALGVLPKSALYARWMQQRGVRHLHAHFATHAALSARFVHALSGIPYSFTAHGHDVHIALDGFDGKARDALFWISISRYNLDLLAGTFGDAVNANAHLVHCGVDLARLQPQPAPGEDELRILCVASFKEVKGHRYLVEACRLLHERGTVFHCTLVGDGPLRADIEARIRAAGLQACFTLKGQLAHPAVLDAMRAADVVVLPSIHASRGDREGIPVCLMEAMALGRPVVASGISGIPELVTHGEEGLLVPEKDPQALAGAFAELAADGPRRVRMGEAGRARVAAGFDLGRNAAELAALFRRSIGNADAG